MGQTISTSFSVDLTLKDKSKKHTSKVRANVFEEYFSIQETYDFENRYIR